MTAVLGSTVCPNLGCDRKRHVSEGGIRYSCCLSCTLQRLAGAFAPLDSPPSIGRPVTTRASSSGARRAAEMASRPAR